MKESHEVVREVMEESDESDSTNKFDHIPEPPLIHMETPGLEDQEYLFVQYDALGMYADSITSDFSRYLAIKCPICDEVKSDWGFHKQSARSDMEMHMSRDHIGKKKLYVTVEKELDYDDPDPLEWVNQFVSGHADVVSFETDVGLVSIEGVSVEIEIGGYRGDVSNERLARYIPKYLDLDMVRSSDMEVTLEYTEPYNPNTEEEIEIAKQNSDGWEL